MSAAEPQRPSAALVRLTDTERYLAEKTGTDIRVTPEGWKVIGLPPTLKERFNLGVTTTQIVQVDRNYSPMPRIVHLDRDEHWYQESGAWAITAKGLDLLSEAGGISWGDPEIDASAHSLFVTARGRRRGPDGTIEEFSDTKGGRYADMERKVRRERKGTLRKINKPWSNTILDDPARLEEELDKAWDDFVEHAAAKIATKARNRVVRHWLGIKSTYATGEKAKPFLVVRWVVTPDYSNPHVGKVIEAQFGAARGALYAAPTDGPLALPAAPVEASGALVEGSGTLVPDIDIDTDDLTVPNDDEFGEPIDAVPVDEPQQPAEDPPGEPEADQGTLQLDGDAERPPRPDRKYTFRQGKYAGQHVEAVLEDPEGLAWVATKTAQMRATPSRDLLLAWIAHNEGIFLTLDDLPALAARATEDAEP